LLERGSHCGGSQRYSRVPVKRQAAV
jgi:hypothetical protein